MFETLRKIYSLLSSQRQKRLLWLSIGMFAMSLAEMGLAGAISLLGVALAAPDSLEKIEPLWKLFQYLPVGGDNIPQSIRMLILVMGMVCLASLLKNLLTALMTYWQGIESQRVAWDIGIRLFDNYLHAPYVWHVQKSPAELIGYLSWRGHVAYVFLGGVQVASQILTMLLLMVGAFVIAPLVSLLLYGVTACSALLVYKAAQRKALETGAATAQLNLETGKVALSAMHGIREVQIYNQQDAFKRCFASFAEPSIKVQACQAVYPALPNWILETTGMCLLLAAIVLMAGRGDSVASITGTLTLMAAVSWRILPALNKVVGGVLQIKSNIEPVQILLSSHLATMPRGNRSAVNRTIRHSLELHDVVFRYPQSNSDALRNVNVTIPRGGMVGIIGLSGAGKSTLVGVLTGLLAPQAGKVLVDGAEVDSAPGFLKIGYVPQHPYIIDAPLAENVAFCSWGEVPDEEKVRQCCRMAAMDFLDDLPQGIHTSLGDRGLRLSGGQMQRVAIARALYGDPDILLFDEATSALDGAAESAIQSTIQELRKGLTVIMIAHRLTTVQNCDCLYWLDGGAVRKHGSAADLLREYECFLREHGNEGIASY